LRLQKNTIQGPDEQSADFHGYFADGAVTLSDAEVPDNLVGQFVGSGTGNKSIPVDVAFLASARSAGNYAGFLGKFSTQAPGFYSMRFYSTDLPHSFGFYPVLEITYLIPEPATLQTAFAGALLLFVTFAGKSRRAKVAGDCLRGDR
jgi:hypothetical protein